MDWSLFWTISSQTVLGGIMLAIPASVIAASVTRSIRRNWNGELETMKFRPGTDL